ncbi:MAG: formate/nitrite transporter family protein [Candidatus Nanopelagicales bacterium]
MSDVRSPVQLIDHAGHSGLAKAELSIPKLFVMSLLGGVFIALGGMLAVVVAGGSPQLLQGNPGLARFVLGAVFPVGFVAVVLTGAGLFTSDCATQTVAWYRGMPGVLMFRVLLVAYLANAVGAVAVALIARAGGWLSADQPWTEYLISLANGKLSHPAAEIFWKGVVANVLVCLAAWQAYASREVAGKILGIWLPVMAFVALGAEHSIANLFFLPAAMLAGAPITVSQFLTANLGWSTLGNLSGGALLIGLPYAWLYAQRPPRTSSRERNSRRRGA